MSRAPKPSSDDEIASTTRRAFLSKGLRIWRVIEAPFKAILGQPIVSASISLAIFVAALVVINVELTKYSVEDLQQAFLGVNALTLMAATVASIVCYGALTLSDRYSVAMLGKSLPFARTARASVAAYALANTLGYSWATAGTARRRLYRKWGLLPNEVGAMSFVSGSAVQVGGLTAAGIGLVLSAREVALHGPLGWLFWFAMGTIVLLPAALWVWFTKAGPLKIELAGAELRRPLPKSGLSHLSVVMLEWLCAAGVLFILLPNQGGWSFPAFVSVYVLAGMLGAVSGAPGGIGVFEAIILTLAPVSQDTPGAAVALLIYRLLYNILPLCLSVIILAVDQAAPIARPAAKAAGRFGGKVSKQVSDSAREFGCQTAAIMVFVAGIGMLGSIATPSFSARIELLARLGLTQIGELTHVLAGVIGTLLLFAAAKLWTGSRRAWTQSVLLLAFGGFISLTKGLEWEQGTLLFLILAMLLAISGSFTREKNATAPALSIGWLAIILGGLITTVWLAGFAYQQLPWRLDTLLNLASDNDVGRTQRAILAVALTVAVMTITRFSTAKNSSR